MDKSKRRRRIVVVDDNLGFRTAAEWFLHTLEGVELAGTAPDGPEGLELVARLRPDAVILDVNMPDMNGFEVAALMRAQPQATGIILVSLDVDQQTRNEAHRLGVDAVLSKAEFVVGLPAILDAIFLKHDRRADARAPDLDQGST